jgi:tetratricopeptide (TPR) repeat protein/predicted AlkP superfamily phosphohydrolase/phosphomutase
LRRIAVLVVLAIAVVIAVSSVKIVGDGEVVLVGEGSRTRELGPGLNFLKPFTAVRRYDLVHAYPLQGKDAISVRLDLSRDAVVEAVVEVTLARDHIRDLDRDYHGRVFEKLVRPLLERELAHHIKAGFDSSRDSLDAVAGQVSATINRKAGALGVEVSSIRLESLTERSRRVHDLKRGDGVKVFVLGFDAYDWLIMDAVSETRSLPNIKRVRREGAWGNLRSIEPLVSPMIWTTMVTGVTPDVHGITDFLTKDESTGQDVPITSSMRRVPALWNITSLFDLTCGFVGWFASFPAEEVRGFVVTDRFAYHMFDPQGRRGARNVAAEVLTYPPGLYEEIGPLKVAPEDATGDLSLYLKGDIGPLKNEYSPDDTDSNLRLIISAYRTYENVMDRLYKSRRPDLFGVYFEFTDSVCHLLMRYMKPPMAGVDAEDYERYGGGIAADYAEADRILGDVLAMVDDSTVVMIVSDHGFKSGDLRPLTDSRVGFGQAIEWHRIDGSIALYGSMVKPGFQLTGASVLDVAPTILYLLGLPVDRKMTGKVLLDAFDDSWVENHPVTYTTEYDSLIGGGEPGVGVSGADKTLRDKLVSLGYVAGGNKSLVNLANYYHRNGQYAKAVEVWEEIVAQDPNDLGARIGLSNAHFELGDDDLAIQGLLKVIEADPGNLEALRSISTIHIKRGRAREALEFAERGLDADPTDGMSYLNKGSALQLMGRTEEAAEAFRRAIEYAPDLAEAYANLSQIYVVSGREYEALEIARKSVELGSSKPEMHYVLGMALSANGRPEEALDAFLAALKIDQKFVPAYIGACGVLMAEGKSDSVLALSERALEIPSPYAAHIHNLRGRVQLGRGELRSATSEFKSAIDSDRSFLPARISLARIYAQEGKREEAISELETVLSINPGDPEARHLLDGLKR